MPKVYDIEGLGPTEFPDDATMAEVLEMGEKLTAPKPAPSNELPPLSRTPQQFKADYLRSDLAATRNVNPLVEYFAKGLDVTPSPSLSASLASPMGMNLRPFRPAPGPVSDVVHEAGRAAFEPLAHTFQPEMAPLIPLLAIPGPLGVLARRAAGIYFGGQTVGQGLGELSAGVQTGDPKQIGHGLGTTAFGAPLVVHGVDRTWENKMQENARTVAEMLNGSRMRDGLNVPHDAADIGPIRQLGMALNPNALSDPAVQPLVEQILRERQPGANLQQPGVERSLDVLSRLVNPELRPGPPVNPIVPGGPALESTRLIERPGGGPAVGGKVSFAAEAPTLTSNVPGVEEPLSEQARLMAQSFVPGERTAALAQQKEPNAPRLRSNQGPVREEGLPVEGGQEARGTDIQQQQTGQAQPSASGVQGGQVSEKGIPSIQPSGTQGVAPTGGKVPGITIKPGEKGGQAGGFVLPGPELIKTVSGFAKTAKVAGQQLFNRAKNILHPDEFKSYEDVGLRTFLSRPRTPDETAEWMKEHGPKVEVKTFEGRGVGSRVAQEHGMAQHELETRGYSLDQDPSGLIIKKEGKKVIPEGASEYYEDPGTFTLAKDLPKEEQELLRKWANTSQEDLGKFDPDKYRGVSPKDVPQTLVMVRVPVTEAQGSYIAKYPNYDRSGVFSKQLLHQGTHFGSEDVNVLGWARGYMETDAQGRKTFHVIEAQSDWAQKLRDIEKASQPGQATPIADRMRHPLIPQWERLTMKAVTDYAREHGAERVAVDDATTAMLTEGHDLASWVQNPDGTLLGPVNDTPGLTKLILSSDPKAKGYKIVTKQEAGMHQHYDATFTLRDKSGNRIGEESFSDAESAKRYAENRIVGLRLRPGEYEVGRGSLHETMAELTGDKGTPVDFGPHQMAHEYEDLTTGTRHTQPNPERGRWGQAQPRRDLFLKEPSGELKTTATGLSYDIGKTQKEFTLFGSDKPKTGGLGVAAAQERAAGQRGETGAINPKGSERRQKEGDDLVKRLMAGIKGPREEGTIGLSDIVRPLGPEEQTTIPESEKPAPAPPNQPIAVRYLTNDQLMNAAGNLESKAIDSDRLNDPDAPKYQDLLRRVTDELTKRGLPSPNRPGGLGWEGTVPEQSKAAGGYLMEQDPTRLEEVKNEFHGSEPMPEGWEPAIDKRRREAEAARQAEIDKVPGMNIPQPEGWMSAFDRKKAAKRRQEEGAISMAPIEDAWKKMSALARSVPVKERIAQLLDAAENQARILGRQYGNEIRALLPKPIQQEALTFVIGARRDPARLPGFLAQIGTKNPKASAAIRYAQANWASLLPVADRVVQMSAVQRFREHNNGVQTINHYEMMYDPRGTGVSSPDFEANKFYANMADAIENEKGIKNFNAADLIERRIAIGMKRINRVKWVESFGAMKDPATGDPLVKPMIKDPFGNDVAPVGYETREVYGGTRVAVKKGYTDILDALTQPSAIRKSMGGRLVLNSEATIKHGLLVFDTFHLSRVLQKEAFLTGGRSAIASLRDKDISRSLLEYNRKTVELLESRGDLPPGSLNAYDGMRPRAQLLIKNGLNVGRIAESLYADIIRKPIMVKGKNLNVAAIFNKWVFEKVSRSAMLNSAMIEFDRTKANNPTWSEEQIASHVAKQINVYYGNLMRQGVFKSATLRDIGQALLLAPQWFESMAQTELRAYYQTAKIPFDLGFERALKVGTLAKGVGRGLAAYFIGTQLINFFTRHHSTMQNPEPEHKLDAWIPDPTGKTGGFFLSPFSVVAELTHDWFRYSHVKQNQLQVAAQILKNKSSPLERSIQTLLSQSDFAGNKILETKDVNKIALKSVLPTPLPIAGATSDTPGQGVRQAFSMGGFKVEPSSRQTFLQDKKAQELYGKNFYDLSIPQRLQVGRQTEKEPLPLQQRYSIAQRATEKEFQRQAGIRNALPRELQAFVEKNGLTVTAPEPSFMRGRTSVSFSEPEKEMLQERAVIHYIDALNRLKATPGFEELPQKGKQIRTDRLLDRAKERARREVISSAAHH